WSVHGAIFAFGLALVDNALLEPVAGVCAELDRDDFMFVTSPLRVEGGTGSPANPLAILCPSPRLAGHRWCRTSQRASGTSSRRPVTAPASISRCACAASDI